MIYYNNNEDLYATYKNGKFTGTSIEDGIPYDWVAQMQPTTSNVIEGFFKTESGPNDTRYMPKREYTIKSISSTDETPIDASQITADNPGYRLLVEKPENLSQYLQVSNEKGGDVTFEKNKFNSRAAVVLGAQYKGWFAGVRGGVSYNQGKIHAKDATGTSTEDVSFASPFVGVHLMKSINMKGLENGHIYVTADVNVQNKQNLKMKGIKNFRQNSVNVSLGMTWQIN